MRRAVLTSIAAYLATRRPGHPLRVGIDGICGVGKSTFARELYSALAETARPVVLVDSDGFHHVRERRYRQGRDSARGYYEDAYDFDALVANVLVPLGPGGSREYARRVHDMASDEVVVGDTATCPADAVVLFDATFLQRNGLREYWDEVVYLHADVETATRRGVARDAGRLGGPENARAAFERRYAAACRIYLDEQRPRERASIVVGHDDPMVPLLERMPG
ncbi:uridine kinase [Cryptosporangium japonicum]|uniref:Uridine kinase n=1 Tax=Cryptosporangium japonicum TaxID=80872 RepID=A0ABP3EMV3_9ACTN